MKFKELSEYFEKIEATASRLTITHLLAELFKKLTASEIEKTVYLLQGRVLPLYEPVEIGMAEKMVIKSIVMALQIQEKEFVDVYKKKGDLGLAVQELKKSIRSLHHKDLSVDEVYDVLFKLAHLSGEGSTGQKISALSHLISQLDSLSARYLVRLPTGTIRLGFSDMTVLDAFSWMIKGDKSLRASIEKGYHVRPDIGFIGKTLKSQGVGAMDKIKPAVFAPILMMRAERLTSGAEIIKKIGATAVESKYDGFRLQLHFNKSGVVNAKTGKKEQVRLYSRNLEEVSFMYPDIVEGAQKELKASEVIIEGEAIGYDHTHHRLLPFQETSQRRRKYDIEAMAKKIPLKFFAFELLYKDGVSYIDKPFKERREKLAVTVKGDDVSKHTFVLSPQEVVEDPATIEKLFDAANKAGYEGIVAKKLDGVYQAGARGFNWIKMKKSYAQKVADTLDTLVMGYDVGRGKRAGFGLGAFLVGVYNPKTETFDTVAKIGTGLTDVEWKELFKRLQKLKTIKKPDNYNVDKLMDVDMWAKPHIVVEIRADELTRSSVHTAGRVMKASKSGTAQVVDTAGFALRFPRLERFRDDKKPEDATTVKEVDSLYKLQRK